MAPVNKGKMLFTCREATCGKNYLSVQDFVLRQVLCNSPLEFIQKDFSNVQNTIDCVLFNLFINE